MSIIIWLILAIVLIVLTIMFWEEVCETVQDQFNYLISFEWWSDFWEFFFGMFENLNEFSIWGILGAVIMVGFIFVTSDMMLFSFTQYMDVFSRIVTVIATYVSSAVVGYLMFKKLFDD